MDNLSALAYVENYSISKGLNDATWQLTATFDKDDAPAAMMGIRAFGTDHLGVENCLFIGFIPSRNFKREITNNQVQITAYDYSWYLSAQHLADKDDMFGYYTTFVCDTIDEIMEALVDETGLTMGGPVTFPCYSDWWHRFYWPPEKIPLDAIKDIEERYDFQFMTFFEEDSPNVWSPKAYMVGHRIQWPHESELDDHVPPMAIFINPSDHVTTLEINESGLEDYNRVQVRGCTFWTGRWFEKTYESSGVTNGDEYPIEYFHVDTSLDTQEKVDAKAWALYALLHDKPSTTYSATLTNRFDLRLLQKVKFVGYTGIPESVMRIISITYNRVLNDDSVVIAFTEDQSFADLKLLARYIKEDTILTQQQVIKDATDRLATASVGEIVEIDSTGKIATVELERGGNKVLARII